MKVTKYSIQACCGRTAMIWKTDQPLSKDHITKLVNLGYVEQTNFTNAGMLYVYNPDFTLSGPLGSDRLTVNCKHKPPGCDQKINDLEVLLRQMG